MIQRNAPRQIDQSRLRSIIRAKAVIAKQPTRTRYRDDRPTTLRLHMRNCSFAEIERRAEIRVNGVLKVGDGEVDDCCYGGEDPGAAEKDVDFNSQIRPILSENCFTCHGPDENARQAELRLDKEEAVFADPQRGILVRGKPGRSELVRRIMSPDPDQQMPPADSNKSLTREEKQLLVRWIRQGAGYQQHWSLVAPVRPAVPDNRKKRWATNDIDRFILARLEKEGVEPSPTASRETLLRRLTLDLNGLPPTLAEIDDFLNDQSEEASTRVVERLLRSPRFGEHMAWNWLDAARYSDTNGYQGDRTRTMSFWRDWVIEAFNNNMPFDKFTIDQLAGDLLENPSLDQLVASGFNRNHPLNGEGGRIPEENRVEYVFDRTETTSTIWMGLTVGCARCHDHKFDPLTQQDYYRMTALFKGAFDEHDWLRPVRQKGAPGIQDRYLPHVSTSERTQWDEKTKEINRNIDAINAATEREQKTRLQQLIQRRIQQLPPAIRNDVARMIRTPEDQRDNVLQYLAMKFESRVRVTLDQLLDEDSTFKSFKESLANNLCKVTCTICNWVYAEFRSEIITTKKWVIVPHIPTFHVKITTGIDVVDQRCFLAYKNPSVTGVNTQ